MPRRIAACALFLAVAFFAAPGRAEPHPTRAAADAVFALEVDLQSEAGARAVLARIRSAAGVTCGGPKEAKLAASRYEACVEDTVARAIRMLGDARLVRLHRGEDAPAGAFQETRR
ncbi:UrcA family protein [Phenylobacterium soli]|uniref:UrcA family protein n=1 Tax=Phenylobacterium soli TaxID=2170551 RepID=A0A328AE61_9CAUL|nr:UrcA family protein [Phenylobacterium soli]RAK53143.1 hypothetical protein DJ017_00645 [Phenylobacterium soli]